MRGRLDEVEKGAVTQKERADKFQELAEGLGKVYARHETVHDPNPGPNLVCGHCAQQSLLTTIAAYTGKRRKDWRWWRTDDYK